MFIAPQLSLSLLALAALSLAVACAPAAPPVAPVPSPVPTRPGAAQPVPNATVTPVSATAVPAVAGALRYTLADTSEARYRVREQLVGLSLPNDAVGSTNSVKGTLTLDGNGAVDPAGSKLTVDLRTLKSDARGRDGFIQQETLETRKFPHAEFVLRAIRGLPLPVPSSGTADLEISGDLTVHGVTKSVVWKAAAQFAENQVKGQAKTTFTWSDFGMQKPVFAQRVFSVEDTAGLELDFVFNKG